MSGGSLDYIYFKVEEAGLQIKRQCRDNPTLKAFGDHMIKMAAALKAVEWYISEDSSLEKAEEAIKQVMGEEQLRQKTIEVLIDEAKGIMEQLRILIEKNS